MIRVSPLLLLCSPLRQHDPSSSQGGELFGASGAKLCVLGKGEHHRRSLKYRFPLYLLATLSGVVQLAYVTLVTLPNLVT
jgi:hypothetical protein